MRPQQLTHLDSTLAALEAARTEGDEAAEWRQCFLALELMHVLDEIARQKAGDDATYYAARDASPDGQVVAALAWFRGATHHQGAPMKEPGEVPVISVSLWTGTEEVPLTFGLWDGQQLVPGALSVLGETWPQRASIPTSNQRARGRDLLYDQHVAGEPLMPPLRAARTFLASRFT